MSAPGRLVLVDGSALVYRAYFAIPASFRTKAGLPTNATYGFASMFRKLFAGKGNPLSSRYLMQFHFHFLTWRGVPLFPRSGTDQRSVQAPLGGAVFRARGRRQRVAGGHLFIQVDAQPGPIAPVQVPSLDLRRAG